MQTLGVSDSTPKSESRLKSLLWPSVRSGSDVDYLSIQGYWVCTLVAVVTLAFGFLASSAARNLAQVTFLTMLSGIIFLFYYLGGVGVREGIVGIGGFRSIMIFRFKICPIFLISAEQHENGNE